MTTSNDNRATLTFGMFAAGLVLMCTQVSLTRLMAAAVGSHATFAILGAVMLGLAASGTRLFTHRARGNAHTPADAMNRAAISGVTSLFAFIALTSIPAIGSNVGLAILCAGIFVMPFYYVGYFITAVLETHTEHASQLYAADLVGASVGAVGSVALLDALSPQGALLALAACCALVTVLLDRRRAYLVISAVIGVLFVAAVLYPQLVELRFANRTDADLIRWQRWDHVGLAAVLDAPEGLRPLVEQGHLGHQAFESVDDRVNLIALSWAMSANYRGPVPDTRYIRIDSGVGTPIVSHEAEHLDVLTWDVTAAGFAASAQPQRVAIVGTGGGRDLLTARNFGATELTAFEINEKVIAAVEVAFRDLSGGPYSRPDVDLQVGDARSRIRGTGPFDVVALPMADTFSASSSGVLIFTENGLYTVEAFDIFLEELADDGILSVARYFAFDGQGEVTRLIATAREALKLRDADPMSHVVVVYGNSLIADTSGIANVLVKKSPFTDADLQRLQTWAEPRSFSLLFPVDAPVNGFSAGAILSGDTSFYDGDYTEISPIYDDRPFFYDAVRPWASIVAAIETGELGLVSWSVRTLLFLLVIVTFAAKILVLDPIRKSDTGEPLPSGHWSSMFFGAIGFGFMAVELAVLQRCTLFLGHPTYALTVVLSSLLVSAALGSWLSGRAQPSRLPHLATIAVVVVILSGVLQPLLFAVTLHASFAVRVALVVALVMPLGTAVGTLYPTALRVLSDEGRTGLVPWCWAVNGTAGVIATIAGMFIAMRLGYTALFACGAIVYVLAIVAARRATQT